MDKYLTAARPNGSNNYTQVPQMNGSSSSDGDVVFIDERHNSSTLPPLKKKINVDDGPSRTQSERANEASEIAKCHAHHREMLEKALKHNQLDPGLSKGIEVIVKKEGTEFKIQYKDREGLLYHKQKEVVDMLKLLVGGKNGKDDNQASSSTHNGPINNQQLKPKTRMESFQSSKSRLKEVLASMPYEVDSTITVYNFGVVDSTRASFHSSHNLFPIGYRVEITVEGQEVRKLICEIQERRHGPEFVVTDMTEGKPPKTFRANSEAEVWTKFRPELRRSFFTTEIEDLLEGMEEALSCRRYKFKIDRPVVPVPGPIVNRAKHPKPLKPTVKPSQITANQEKKQKTDHEKEVVSTASKQITKMSSSMVSDTFLAKKKLLEADKLVKEYRKEITRALKKSQEDSLRSIQTYLDNEVDQTCSIDTNEEHIDGSDAISSYLVPLTSIDGWASIFQMANFAHAFREYLDVDETNLKTLVSHLDLISSDCTSSTVEDQRQALDKKCKVEAQDIDTVINTDNTKVISKDMPESKALEEHKDEEEELQFENEVKSLKATAMSTALPRSLDSDCAEVTFDRLEIMMARIISMDLGKALELNEELGTDNKKATGPALAFPVNQMTWQEITRMAIITHLMKIMDKSKDETLHILRGAKGATVPKTAKNVARAIRYRFAYSAQASNHVNNEQHKVLSDSVSCEDVVFALKQIPLSETHVASFSVRNITDIVEDSGKEIQILNEMTLFEALSEKMAETSTPEAYRRCIAVLLKVLSMSQSKNLIWEISREEYPEYYDVIKHPMSFHAVALRLIYLMYDNLETLPIHFYLEMRQVLLNCITYNTENVSIYMQACKLLPVVYRHVERWVLSSSPPPVEKCSDHFCLMSGDAIENSKSIVTAIKCGRCCGSFSLSYLDINKNKIDGIYEISTELATNVYDDWICPLCLNENTNKIVSEDTPLFTINEWGPSSSVPWLLNPSYSGKLDSIRDQNVSGLIQAAHILSREISAMKVFSKEVGNLRRWTRVERLTVLSALVDITMQSSRTQTWITNATAECGKLEKLAIAERFQAGDFLRCVRNIAGEKAASLTRSLLKEKLTPIGSIEDDGLDDSGAFNRVMEGRCVQCKAYSDLQDSDNKDIPTIICEYCSNEAHLKCLGLEKVPTEEWFCDICKACGNDCKPSADDDKYISNMHNLIEQSRREELEKKLTRIHAQLNFGDNKGKTFESTEYCEICGKLEVDLCSPFVIGQNVHEFKDFIGRQAKQVHATRMPFYPLVTASTRSALSADSFTCPIVHEFCALYMHKGRLDRRRNDARRIRRLVAEKTSQAFGMFLQPLGIDDQNRTFWKFPTSPDLFVQVNRIVSFDEELKIALKANISKSKSKRVDEISDSKESADWYTVTDKNSILGIINCLGTSRNERILRTNLRNTYFILTEFGNPEVLCIGGGPFALKENNDESENDAPNVPISSVTMIEQSEEKISQKTLEVPVETQTVHPVILDVDDDTAKPVDISRSSSMGDSLASIGNRFENFKLSAMVPPGVSTSSNSNVVSATEKSIHDELTVTSLKLIYGGREKGLPIQSHVELESEDVYVFIDKDTEADDAHKQYFTYSKKYYAIGLINSSGKRIRKKKKSGSVIYEIFREGTPYALAYTPLDDAWSDLLYYFQTAVFKKSGNYLISFHIDGVEYAHVQPLYFPVRVRSSYVRFGTEYALGQLKANEYLQRPGRQIVSSGLDIFTDLDVLNECDSVKRLLLSVYYALPVGSLETGPVMSNENIFDTISEASWWNDLLEPTWRTEVKAASHATQLMECILLLEYYINKSWLTGAQRILNALPSPHFALRSATFSSVSLRIFCLDQCIDYSKVVYAPRNARGARATTVSVAPAPAPAARSTRPPPKKRMIDSEDEDSEDSEDEENEESEEYSDASDNYNSKSRKSKGRGGKAQPFRHPPSRPQRNAAIRASAKLRDASDDDMDFEEAPRRAAVALKATSSTEASVTGSWICIACTSRNEPRARSCHICQARKPSVPPPPSDNTRAEPEPSRNRSRRQISDTSSDEEASPVEKKAGKEAWSCDKCTAINESRARSCTVCDSKKIVPILSSRLKEKLDEDLWWCDCGVYNQQLKKRCEHCNELRKNSYLSSSSALKRSGGDSGSKTKKRKIDEEMYLIDLPMKEDNEAFIDFIALIDEGKTSLKTCEVEDDRKVLDLKLRAFYILQFFQKIEESYTFWEPVDLSTVKNYLNYIDQPMDISTIARKVALDIYGSDAELFNEDFSLVWDNCLKYNQDGSSLFQLAQMLQLQYQEVYAMWFVNGMSLGDWTP